MRKKVWLFVLLFACLCTLVFAGGQKEGAGKPATVMFWSKEGDPPSVDVYNSIIAEFQSANPQIKVDMQIVNEIDDKVKAMVAAGGKIDIFQPNVYTSNALMFEGLLLPLTDVFDELGGTKEFIHKDYLLDKNGKPVTIPYATGGWVWWIRKDLLSQTGTPLPNTKRGWTWDESLQAAAKLNSSSHSGVGLPASTGDVTYFMFEMAAWCNGIDAFDANLNPQLDHPRNIEALEYYTAMLKYAPADVVEWSWFNMVDAFTSGRVAMTNYAGRILGRIYTEKPELKGKAMVIQLPYNKNFTTACVQDINTNAVYAKTEYPEQAKAFLKFMHKPENAAKFLATVPGHLLPNTPAEQKALMAMNIPALVENPEIMDVIFDAANHAFDPASMVGGLDFANKKIVNTGKLNPYLIAIGDGEIIGTAVQKVHLQGVAPAVALAEAQKEFVARVEDIKKEQSK
jgi:ABC-type glycerol-3-phosphate transport system substrate-binding protein